jgi:hypothetical protein
MSEKIDKLAYAGYDYAISKGKNDKSSLIKNDLDLMAFNAGISNANIRHNMSVTKISCSPTIRKHDNYQGASDKELSLL